MASETENADAIEQPVELALVEDAGESFAEVSQIGIVPEITGESTQVENQDSSLNETSSANLATEASNGSIITEPAIVSGEAHPSIEPSPTEAEAVQNNGTASPDTSLDAKAFLESISIPTSEVIPQSVTVDNAKSVHNEPILTTPTLPMPPLANSQPTSPVDETISAPTAESPNLATTASLQMLNPPPVLSTGSNGLPPPPSASFQQSQFHPLPAAPTFGSTLPPYGEDDGGFFPPELEAPFDEFLRIERVNMNEGNWDKFPDGSRLFIGNLPTEKATKRDVFKKFYPYGKLAQISMKQAFGFVQYLDAESCARAKEVEQDTLLRGRRIHLEISRPNRGGKDRAGRRRSRSPDHNRNRNERPGGVTGRERDREYRRSRDDYRPNRSPSPRGYRRNRTPDRYDNRRRSRSRSPYRDSGHKPEDDLPLPHRQPHEVPDVQILVVDELNRDFISYVESVFPKRGLRSDVLILSSRLSEDAVIRRQIVEGVLAVVRISRINQATGKVPLRLFDRSGGVGNVKFEDYENLDPTVAAELVHRMKPASAPQTFSPVTAGAQYGAPSGHPPPANNQPDFSALLGQYGSRPELQSLLSALQAQQQVPQQQQHASAPAISQQLLAALGAQQPAGYGQPAAQNLSSLASLLGQPQMAAPSNHPPAQHGQGSQPDMAEIMAQLSKYQR